MAFRKKSASPPPPPPPPRTLFEKIWDSHVVSRQDDGTCVIYIDRHLVHEVTSPQAFEGLRLANRPVRRPDATVAVADHNTPTTAGAMDEESRIQVYEGQCIARKNAGVNSSFTVRKISFDEGVERVFPLYSPNIWEIEVVRKGIVRRAKLYYLRNLRGKASRIAEDVEAQRELIAEQTPRREKLKKEKPKGEKTVRAAKGGGKR